MGEWVVFILIMIHMKLMIIFLIFAYSEFVSKMKTEVRTRRKKDFLHYMYICVHVC